LALASFLVEDGCLLSSAEVRGIRDEVKPEAPVTSALIVGFVFDLCTSERLHDFFGLAEIPDANFFVGKKGENATLVTTLDADDFETGDILQFQINVTWLATARPNRMHVVSQTHFGDKAFSKNKVNGTGVSASAAGTVSDGVTNYAAASTEDAFIFIDSSSSILHLKQ
jgi:hypothetical protein